MLVVTLARIGANRAIKKALNLVAVCRGEISSCHIRSCPRFTYHYTQAFNDIAEISGCFHTRTAFAGLDAHLEVFHEGYPRFIDFTVENLRCQWRGYRDI